MTETTLPVPPDPTWLNAPADPPADPCPQCDGHGEHPTSDPQITVPCPACAGRGHTPYRVEMDRTS